MASSGAQTAAALPNDGDRHAGHAAEHHEDVPDDVLPTTQLRGDENGDLPKVLNKLS